MVALQIFEGVMQLPECSYAVADKVVKMKGIYQTWGIQGHKVDH